MVQEFAPSLKYQLPDSAELLALSGKDRLTLYLVISTVFESIYLSAVTIFSRMKDHSLLRWKRHFAHSTNGPRPITELNDGVAVNGSRMIGATAKTPRLSVAICIRQTSHQSKLLELLSPPLGKSWRSPTVGAWGDRQQKPRKIRRQYKFGLVIFGYRI